MKRNNKSGKPFQRKAQPHQKERLLLGISIFFLLIWISASVFDFGSSSAQTNGNNKLPLNVPASNSGIGLRADYFNNTNLSGRPVLTKIDPNIDFGWGHWPGSVINLANNYSIRWSGYVKAPSNGLYRFHTLSDDGVRLWINGTLVIDNWTNHGTTTDISNGIRLVAGRKYQIKLEYFQGTGGAVIQLLWGQSKNELTLVPQSLLYPEVGAPSQTPTPSPTATPTPSSENGVIYVAEMRPDGSVTSPGSGSSTLRLSADERSAVIRFNFANLTTTVNAAHVHGLADPGSNAPILFDFDTAPRAPDGSFTWTFAPAGNLSVAQIVDGIKTGRTYINVHTSRFPSGEIRGHYHQVRGSSVFTPPPSAPPVPPGPTNAQDAARFLTQSSFGVTDAELTRVQQMGFDAYLNAQFNAPTTSHVAYLQANERPGEHLNTRSTMESFWQKAITGNDQLRQRMAFALSEIFVVSDVSGMGVDQPYALSGYLDTLQADSFGNFRDLLKDVTLNPAMGQYLNMRANIKEDVASGRIPNENYAREVNQLFSIGLYKLHPDGTLILDENGQPIPTYDQSVIMGFAHVFTGWNFGSLRTTNNNWGYFQSWDNDNHQTWIVPMQPWEYHHSQAPKKLLNGVVLPPGQSARRDMEMAIDNIFNHPNVGPFICRQLIQRLVTSNPSPGYVYRVASVFNNNGAGVRGDLKAVVRAILLDYEARSPEFINQQGYGKQREPILRFSALLRSFNARGENGVFTLWDLQSPIWALGQNPLRAPNVFNFFEPSFSQPGAISAAGLTSPEFKLTDDTQIIGSTNLTSGEIYGGGGINGVRLDLSNMLPRANNPGEMVDYLNLLLMSGQMSPAMRNIIVSTVTLVPQDNPDWRVKMAIHLIVTSPQFAIQK